MQNISQPSTLSSSYKFDKSDAMRFSDSLDLSQVFHKALSSATSILMDTCRLSYSQVRFTLAPVCQLISYQLLAMHKRNGLNHILNASVITDTLKINACSQGFNFQTVKGVEPFVNPVCQAVFSDTRQYDKSIGLLLAYTPLSLAQLERFLPWCTLLCVRALTDIAKCSTNQLNDTHALEKFLAWQPILLANTPLSNVFAEVTGYHHSISQQTRLTELRRINRAPDNNQQAWANLISDYLRQAPFSIATIQAKPRKTVSTTPIAHGHRASTDIFAKHTVTPRKKWLDTLQKYWIATATATSVVVFGGLGLLQHNHSKTNKITQPSVASATTEKRYNDVAIVRVASQPAPMITEATTDTPNDSLAQASTTQSTSNTRNDSVKTTKNSEQVTDKSPKKTTTQKTDEKKSADSKATKKTNTASDKDKTVTNKKADKKQTDKEATDKKPTSKKLVTKKSTDSNTDKATDKKTAKTVKKSTNDTSKKKTSDKTDSKKTE